TPIAPNPTGASKNGLSATRTSSCRSKTVATRGDRRRLGTALQRRKCKCKQGEGNQDFPPLQVFQTSLSGSAPVYFMITFWAWERNLPTVSESSWATGRRASVPYPQNRANPWRNAEPCGCCRRPCRDCCWSCIRCPG